jgi:large repetitive protein
MKPSKTTALLSTLACSALLAACGGIAETYGFVSGTLSGLPAGLQATLQNNGGDDVVITANGPFTFPTKLPSLGAWSITVASQPTNQFCTVTRPTGVIPTDGLQANVTTIACAPNSLAVTVTGLAAGQSVVLTNTATTTTNTTTSVSTVLTASTNGFNTFSGILAGAVTYSVVVTTQPTGQTCTLSNATGTITAGAQSQVSLNCI